MQKINPFRSKAYRKFVAQLPSVVSGRPGEVAHHIKGDGFGGSVKCSDLFTIPLTHEEHNEFHAIGWETWEARHNICQKKAALKTIDLALAKGKLPLADKDLRLRSEYIDEHQF